jgi:hypothetical protein
MSFFSSSSFRLYFGIWATVSIPDEFSKKTAVFFYQNALHLQPKTEIPKGKSQIPVETGIWSL